MSRIFPNRLLYARYLLEFGTFGMGLAPHLVKGNFDLVHFIDPPLARCLHAIRRLTGGRYRLLFSNCRPWSFDCSRWADHIHCINPGAAEEAQRGGLEPGRLSMIPIGLDARNLALTTSREELRRQYGVPADRFMVLSVTSLNRAHKRVDYLIEEAAKVDGNLLLWVDGSFHPDGDPTLLAQASERLGARFRHSHVPSDRVGDLFRMADVFVSSAITESFGMAIVEAMCSRLPVIVHDSAHFRWLTSGQATFSDMSVAGNLADCLRRSMRNSASLGDPGAIEQAARRFEWERLSPEYLAMYDRALQACPHGGQDGLRTDYYGRTL